MVTVVQRSVLGIAFLGNSPKMSLQKLSEEHWYCRAFGFFVRLLTS